MPRFSIITVALNAEKYLNDTLTSVAGQEFKDFEHIVWDGGSTDGTLEIVSRFPHAKLVCGKDTGISDAMNKGASFATGEFMLHLHADDMLAHSKALLWVDTCLRQHSQARWLYGKADVIDAAGNKVQESSFTPFDPKRLRKYNLLAHPATFLETSLFHQIGGFDTKLRYCMDYDLWLRLSAHGKNALALPASLACFRAHPQSLSTKEKQGVADEAYQVRNHYVTTFFERWRSYRTWRRRRKKIF